MLKHSQPTWQGRLWGILLTEYGRFGTRNCANDENLHNVVFLGRKAGCGGVGLRVSGGIMRKKYAVPVNFLRSIVTNVARNSLEDRE